MIRIKKVLLLEENIFENNFFGEFGEVILNFSLFLFSRIGEVLDYELVEEIL